MGSESETVELANEDRGNEWHMYQVPIAANVHYIQFIATKGIGDGILAIDDVEFTTESCISKLIT